VLRLCYTRQARRDFLDIWLVIAAENPEAAERVYDRLEARVNSLTQFPELGAERRDIADTARVLIIRPYLILYRIFEDAVQIVRVLHRARQIDSVLFHAGFSGNEGMMG
jgi:toxin ParE1/3/4